MALGATMSAPASACERAVRASDTRAASLSTDPSEASGPQSGKTKAVSAKENSFAETYADLLRESASMTVEELAAKYLDADLHEAGFWENAVGSATADIDRFLELTEAGEELDR